MLATSHWNIEQIPHDLCDLLIFNISIWFWKWSISMSDWNDSSDLPPIGTGCGISFPWASLLWTPRHGDAQVVCGGFFFPWHPFCACRVYWRWNWGSLAQGCEAIQLFARLHAYNKSVKFVILLGYLHSSSLFFVLPHQQLHIYVTTGNASPGLIYS